MKQDPTESESYFNMGVAYLKRIDRILYMCWINSQVFNVQGWLNQLRALYRELSIKLDKVQKEDIMEDFVSINKVVNEGVNPSNTNGLLSSLDKLEIKLRGLAQKKGLLLPSKEDPRFAITQK